MPEPDWMAGTIGSAEYEFAPLGCRLRRRQNREQVGCNRHSRLSSMASIIRQRAWLWPCERTSNGSISHALKFGRRPSPGCHFQRTPLMSSQRSKRTSGAPQHRGASRTVHGCRLLRRSGHYGTKQRVDLLHREQGPGFVRPGHNLLG